MRPCTTSDVAAVLRLWRVAAAAHSLTDDPAAVRRRLKRDRRLFLLALDGSRLIGTIVGGWDGWRGSMARLAVDPEYRRRGIGRMLLALAEAELRALGAKRISAIVLEENGEGRAFWSGAGYRIDSEVSRYVKDISRERRRSEARR